MRPPALLRPRALVAVLIAPACQFSEKEKPLVCGVNMHGDDATCNNGESEPGELCLEFALSLPRSGYMHPYTNLTAADFNGDGHLDLRIGSDIHPGNGDGTFAETSFRFPGSNLAYDCGSGDFNGDGLADMACAHYVMNVFDDPNQAPDSKFVTFWFGNPELDWSKLSTIPDVGEYPVRIHAADFNSDGLDDLAIPRRSWDVLSCFTLIVLSGKDGTFQFTTALSAQGSFDGCTTLIADLDLDGNIDVDTYFASEVYFGAGDGTFEERAVHWDRPSWRSRAPRDLDCDGQPDIVDSTLDGFIAWKNLGKAKFERHVLALESDPELRGDFAVIELNGDLEPDIVVAAPSKLVVYFGDDGLDFSGPSLVRDGVSYEEIETADFNEDGRPDLAVLSANGVDIFLTRL